jgi:hypothetical protein
MNNLNQSARPGVPGSINNEQTRLPKDSLRDLPPKSPGSRRVIPTLPTKIKRGEVMIYSECEYICVVNRIWRNHH